MCETLSLTADSNIIPKLHTYQNQLTMQTNGKSITDKTSLKAAKGVVNHHHTGLFTVNDCEIQALSMLSNVSRLTVICYHIVTVCHLHCIYIYCVMYTM